MFETFIQDSWTILSAVAVLLALGAIGYAWAEKRDAMKDFYAQLNQRLRDPVIVHLAIHEYKDARRLFWAHVGVFAHQTIFLWIGLYAIFTPRLEDPNELPSVMDRVIPLSLLSAQLIIVAMQIILFGMSKSQRRSRKALNEIYESQRLEEAQESNTEDAPNVDR